MTPSALHLRPYRDGDAAKILPRWDFAAEHAAAGSPLFQAHPAGTAWTLVAGEDPAMGRPIACGGALRHHPDEQPHDWSLWGYAGELTLREWTYVRRGAAVLLERLEARGGRRAFACVRADHPGAGRFLAGLGFEATGVEDGATVMTCRLEAA